MQITFGDGANDAFDHAIEGFKGYVCKVTLTDGREFDAVVRTPRLFRLIDDEGRMSGEEVDLSDRTNGPWVETIHVY